MARKIVGRSPAPAALPYSARRGIVASAQRIDLKDRVETQEVANRSARSAWQSDAWRCYDSVGEIKFAYGLVASVMSRLRLYPAFVADIDSPPIPLTDAAEIKRPEGESEDEDAAVYRREVGITPQQALAVRDAFRKQMSKSSIPSILRSFVLNINTPGECYLALIGGEWSIKSTDEIKIQTDGTANMYRTSTSQPRKLEDSTTIGRIWREHPRYSYDADSALRALIDDCDELLLLSQVIRSNGRARLNAGILFVPDEIAAGKITETDDQGVETEEEVDLEKELFEALSAGIASEDSANNVVPLLFRGPTEAGKGLVHIKLERVIDEFLVNRSDRTLERILQGLDVPKDLVTGLANVKYSNAIQIDESLYKAHIEPLALVICDAMTDIVLRPHLRALVREDETNGTESGWTDELVDRIVVWYDPSEVVTRPDRAADAAALYDKKELSGAALRNAHGFTENDAPDEQELARRLAVEGQVPEAVMNVLLQTVLPNVLKKLAAASGGQLPGSLQETLNGSDPAADPLADPGLEPTYPADGSMSTAPTDPAVDPAAAVPAPA